MATAWDKLEQLLTCAICLDRFRNPKMLPCQHSFCQEPCMEGLQDYARRQIKCPECRAEHRIPFQGIQSYPTNVTLQRFLELHQSITGEEPEPVPSMMERCGVCSEKSNVVRCSHCDKKVCSECKEAHLDILKREISRICHQVRRALNRLQDALSQTERSVERLNISSVHIRDEIEEIVRRFVKDIKAQEDKMLKDLETYSQAEAKNLSKLKDDLEVEYDYLKDNCDLVEKHVVDPDKTWTDVELVEVKDIFVKTLDFLRNFDTDAADYTRGMKFLPSAELDTLRRNLINFGELKLPTPEEVNQATRASSPSLLSTSASTLSIPQQNMLMRSQSDHRLAAQFARRDSRMNDLVTSQSRLNVSNFSDAEKDPRDPNRATSPSYSRNRRDDVSRLGRYGETDRARFSDTYRSGWSRPDEDSYSGPQFKSRFMKERGAELGFDDHTFDDPGSYIPRSVRFEEPAAPSQPAPVVKVFNTPEAPRGSLSGIIKLSDTAHYMERVHENDVRAKVEKEKKDEESKNPPPPSMPAYQPSRRPPSRQVSEDEIEKQKKMNQASGNSSASSTVPSSNTNSPSYTTPSVPLSSTGPTGQSIKSSVLSSSDVSRPISRRIGSLRDEDDGRSNSSSLASSRQGSRDESTPITTASRREPEVTSLAGDDADDDDSALSRSGRRRRGSLSTEDSKDSVSSNRSSQISSGSRPVRAPLAKNVPIVEEEEDRDREALRRRGGATSTTTPLTGPGSSLGLSNNGKQTSYFNRNRILTGCAVDQRRTKDELGDDDDDDDEDDDEDASETEEEDEEEEEEEEEEEDDRSESGESENDHRNPLTPLTATNPRLKQATNLDRYTNAGPNLVSGSVTSPSTLRNFGSYSTDLSSPPLNRTANPLNRQITASTATSTPPALPSSSTSLQNQQQADKGRENGLPCSVADLLNRSAQVRRDSTELRQRVDPSKMKSDSKYKSAYSRVSSLTPSSAFGSRGRLDEEPESPGSPTLHSAAGQTYSFDRTPRTTSLRTILDDGLDCPQGASSSSRFPRKDPLLSNTNLTNDGDDLGPDNYIPKSKHANARREQTSDRSSFSAAPSHSNSITGRRISPASTSATASSASAATTASAAFAPSLNSALAARSSRLSRSKSSHLLGVYSSGHDGSEDDDDTSSPAVPTYRSRYAETNYGKEGRYQYRTRQPKDREKSPVNLDEASNSGPNAWSQYLRNKYGSSGSSSTGSTSRLSGLSKSKSSHAVYSRNLSESSDEESTAPPTKPLSRKGSLDVDGMDGRRPSYGYSLPRSTYLQKRRMMFKIGTRGTEPGCFTWPRGIACGPDNSIVVADSSNHRVQVFDSTGRFTHEFGSYGSGEGEFDCLAGVAVNRIGQFIVSDRYNHRVQIFDPSGRFLRSFGCEGRVDGRFSYPWGITTDSLGFIYVCDKENHRIQVFQSDGTFVGKFGSIGSRPGLLEHPHYIAVSNTNRVIVSDSNNHRIQIFDVNGRSLSTFGCEGTEEGQFKFPRGVAVDDQGYIIVGDSGNNRIQIFNPDGTFLKSFGSWGSSESEFKGLEGVAVSTTGNILVCDRENHRIQVF